MKKPNMRYFYGYPQGKVLPVCNICNLVPFSGIRGGVKFKSGFICFECESSIVKMEVGSPQYDIIVNKMKSILGSNI